MIFKNFKKSVLLASALLFFMIIAFSGCSSNTEATNQGATDNNPPAGDNAGNENQTVCGNGTCDSGEENSCVQDCPQQPESQNTCGDGICANNENKDNCLADCSLSECGNGVCEESAETPESCPSDCREKIGREVTKNEAGWLYSLQGAGQYAGKTLAIDIVKITQTGATNLDCEATLNIYLNDQKTLLSTVIVKAGDYVEQKAVDGSGNPVLGTKILVKTVVITTITGEKRVEMLVYK